MTKRKLSTLLICLFCFTLFLQSCKKDNKSDPVPTTGNNNTTDGANFYFTGSIDGASKNFIQKGDNDTIASAVGASNSISSSSYSTFKYITSVSVVESLESEMAKESIEIMKGTLKELSAGMASDSLFFTFFKKGAVSYSTDAVNGIEITYYDRNQIMWSTSLGAQTESTFSFDSIEEVESDIGSFVFFTASFSCKVYDDKGNFKVISNGKMKSYFQNM